ncbi:uncharacterized protein LACBIDRAFT_323858 [Laccaria bicolor S238N-H82]|uniref:Predicted protein n=1 Tax=Laccaria bicolor (strain S238N-H82 / ATCC MYA-4686) TaxID=486041 RepID=B0CZ09_LACBS|nr:uncharacterized protein LACBIDRAFT_323858 [Laccaria bicolor S238N-H82]EDR12542.1 predicted protein [Laccaria bicolor S238N-H82]|eukprot:XP_001876806.1 predicted protein [Laccaria bicolor S238N-H82]
MVHRCLLVPELFSLVCDVLRHDCKMRLRQRSATLASLALTCRAFEGPALDVLWREIDGLRPLLCTMPSDLFEMKAKDWSRQVHILCLRRPILLSDLTRLPSYAQRIRKLRVDSTPSVDIGALQALGMATLHMRPLLPNLEDLMWGYGYLAKEVEWSMFQCIYLFFSPKLTRLSVFLSNIFDHACPPSILSGLINSCPALKELTFYIQSSNSDEENRRGISSAICQWNCLQSLTVNGLTQEALEHLATIPSLQTLSLNSLQDVTRADNQHLPIVTRIPTSGYPALQSLSISCRTINAVIAFVQLLSSSPLEDLEIQVGDLCYLRQWRELFSSISRHICHPSLEALTLQESGNALEPPEALISDIGLEALSVFTNLQTVDIQPAFGIQLTSDTVNRLADAWPNIRSLELGNMSPWPRSSIIKTEDLIPFAQRCSKLSYLGIVFDAQNTQLRLSPGFFNNNLTSLSVADSPINAPPKVAAFLSDIFPRIESITFADDWRDSTDGDPENATETARMWDEAECLLETFAMSRTNKDNNFGDLFESPVRSGFLMPRGVNRNRNRSAFSPEVKRPDRTAKRPQTAVFCGL